MLSLRAEIAACLLAVSLLGLIVGWMMQRSRGAGRLRRTVEALEERHAVAEKSARQDIENLEDRLQELGDEVRTLAAENRELREGSHGGRESLETARAESIELNRRQGETQERLQRIIREREREIATLRAGLVGREPVFTAAPDDITTGAADGLDETVRIDPALLPARRSGLIPDDRGEAHALHPTRTAAAVAANLSPDDGAPALDDTLENTMDVAFLDAEEATIALDEETLSLVRGLGRGERKL